MLVVLALMIMATFDSVILHSYNASWQLMFTSHFFLSLSLIFSAYLLRLL